jgi:hypothetical protein
MRQHGAVPETGADGGSAPKGVGAPASRVTIALQRAEMQRRLMLMRHAKSAWTSHVPTDHERPLNKRGRRDAPRIGKPTMPVTDMFWGDRFGRVADPFGVRWGIATHTGESESHPSPRKPRGSPWHRARYASRAAAATGMPRDGASVTLRRTGRGR